ncbi:response regulator transcription factor [Pararhodobacter sp. CCB-MM2]|uniref:response regulator transcription factor n=1 Tax=Pararhodobacter sp. CCB-MM2 TaxID=1786003 RepID=UPI00083483F3|nr:response regulator [Pararhodobacter sp. CCB-MM2]
MTPPSPRATILYIEDEAALREELAEELTNAGYHALDAADAEAAEDLLAQAIAAGHPPDLVLCDVMLPGRSGVQWLRDLRAAGTVTEALPFLFLTALSDRDSHLEGLRAGATDYLVKPIDLDQLHLKIENLLAHARSLRDARHRAEAHISLPPAHLSPRETQVLGFLGQGARTVEIAYQLQISEHTVNQYIKDVYRKLGLGNRADAARAALQLGLLGPGAP